MEKESKANLFFSFKDKEDLRLLLLEDPLAQQLGRRDDELFHVLIDSQLSYEFQNQWSVFWMCESKLRHDVLLWSSLITDVLLLITDSLLLIIDGQLMITDIVAQRGINIGVLKRRFRNTSFASVEGDMTDAIIQIDGLTKRFDEKKGVFDLHLDIKKGEVFGFLGPNGAGKTTTVRHLMGFIQPDQGACSISGHNCWRDSHLFKGDLGYLPGEIAFFDDMKGDAFLRFMTELRGTTSPRKEEMLERFDFNPTGRIKKMSKGMKQKLGLVAAFMDDPEVFILDEPTSGLDPLMQNRFVELLLEEKKRGKTIFLSSHSFEEVEKTCDRVGLIKDGVLQEVAQIDQLKSARRRVFSVTFLDPGVAQRFLQEGFEVVFHNEHRVDVAITGDINPFIQAIGRYEVTGLDVVSQSLEDIFMGYYGGAR